MRALSFYLLVMLNASEAAPPALKDFVVKLSTIDSYAKAVVPAVDSSSRCLRDLGYDAPEAPNFADRFTLFVTGCGTGCAEFCVVDRITGRVLPGFDFDGGPEFEFSRESRLVIVKHTDGMYAESNPYFADCYLWEGDHFRFFGRWVSTYGEAPKGKLMDWRPTIALEPNQPNWRTK